MIIPLVYKRLDSRHRFAQDQRMNILASGQYIGSMSLISSYIGTLIRVDHLQICYVPANVISAMY